MAQTPNDPSDPNDPNRPDPPQRPGQPPTNPYGQDQRPGPDPGQYPEGHYPGQPAGRYPGPDDRAPANAVESRGFFGALFDFGFTSFVTIKFATFIYILLIVLIAGAWLFSIVAGFMESTASGLFVLLLGWIPGLITLILARVMMEFYIAMVRTSQNTAATRAELEALRAEGRRR